MKASKLLLAMLVLAAASTSTYAGPGAQYWQQRRNPPASADTKTAPKDQAPAKSEAAPAKCEGAQNCPQCNAKS